MKYSILFCSFLCFVFFSCQPEVDETAEKQAITRVMMEQEQAWNRGDIEAFMAGYSRNDSTLFVGKTRVSYGWETVLTNYRKAYSDAKAMGQLQFNLIRINLLSPVSAYVVGRWELSETSQAASGHFLLIFAKENGEWKITVDGTS